MSEKKLSVCTVVDNPITKEFCLKELIESVWQIADEIIVINADQYKCHRSETYNLLWDNLATDKDQYDYDKIGKIRLYHIPWSWRLGCITPRLMKSLAINYCTEDYCLLLDADEVLFEQDHDKIKQCLELGHFAYATHTIHWYRDFNHVKTNYYDYRTHLFKNNGYVFDMHNSNGQYDCGLVQANMADKEEDRQFINLMEHPDMQLTSIRIGHIGHTRSKEAYVKKTNAIEKSYHPMFHDIKEEEFEWNMSNTEKYTGDYPEALKERIKEHKNKCPEYYDN